MTAKQALIQSSWLTTRRAAWILDYGFCKQKHYNQGFTNQVLRGGGGGNPRQTPQCAIVARLPSKQVELCLKIEQFKVSLAKCNGSFKITCCLYRLSLSSGIYLPFGIHPVRQTDFNKTYTTRSVIILASFLVEKTAQWAVTGGEN